MENTGTKKEKYLVEGMTCTGCERTISKVVSNVPGVKFSKTDLASSSVFVEYDPSTTTIDQIKSAVSGIGFKIVGQLPPLGQHEGNDEGIP